ncbi:exopolyphosphatase [Saccharopolyspora griseoalba]|uniref:Exopolyphosphatase n=1 Tax=Saccharopolyspora griseoalba TaxID=1431848 RepID=A0ABW2LPK8_9PSEU
MKLGLLDIGSAAARLEVVDLDDPRMPRAAWSAKARTRLAEHTLVSGEVTEEGAQQAVRAVRYCVRAAEEAAPDALIAYGTAAVRDATNAAELRERLGAAAGVQVRALSPSDEAAVAHHAARRWRGRSGRALTTVDIGGGTTDVVTGTGERPPEVVTLPFGAARLTRSYLPDDPPRPEQVAELDELLRATIPRSLERIARRERGHPIALSKVLRQLAVLAESGAGGTARHPHRLRRSMLTPWIPVLAELDQRQRAKLPGVSRNRGRRILAGAMTADRVLEALGVEELEICPWGLREGLVYRFVEAETETPREALALAGDLFS